MAIPHSNAPQEPQLICLTALELKDRGDYDGALRAMAPLWRGVGYRPNTMRLSDEAAAEVLLTSGVLTRWLGNRNEVKEANDYAKDLISESIRFYESLHDLRKAAEARSELGFCYWRVGEHDNARILFNEALERLTTGGNDRANAIIGLSFVAWSESRYNEVLKVLTENAELFERITNRVHRGTFHNQLGITLRAIGAASKKRADYFQRAINEFSAADEQFKLAKHIVFRAHVKNNIANVLRDLGRFGEAHQQLDQALRLFKRVRDKVRTAQVNESRAQLFIAEGKYRKAAQTARNAAHSFERAGRQSLFAEALITSGIALARLRETEHAEFIFRKAIERAHQAGSLNSAGLAALAMIEELDSVSGELQLVAYNQARKWLADSQSAKTRQRLKAVRERLGSKLLHPRKSKVGDVSELLFNNRRDLEDEVLKYERELIRQTLAKVHGRVTDAAELLNMGYQRLAHRIETKHPELLRQRTPVHRRPRLS
jgi:tetratricopeptide (TPR) repeat protein